jgi:hypothetical protein
LSPAKPLIVAGSVAQKPGNGGHTWVFLQYLLGFKKLGWPVLLLDRLEPEMCTDHAGRPASPADSWNLQYLQGVMDRFGLGDSYSVLYEGGQKSFGLPRSEMLERVSSSALLLNVNGFIRDPEVLATASLRAFLDIDPGFGQMWRELGLHDPFSDHDALVTIGERIGRRDCAIPTGGLEWLTTPQPVVLDHWPAQEPGGEAFTSVASWRGAFGPVEFGGETYGLRVHEFRKFARLPTLASERFEIALDIDPAESRDLELLHECGWSLADPAIVAGDPFAYRDFVQSSRGEFMVAKNMYVRARSGWFSDRSICYLASGKPVLAEDTGFSELYPTGEGLVSFTTLEEAVAGVERIASDYEHHASRARAIAEAHFDSDQVLARLLSSLGVA